MKIRRIILLLVAMLLTGCGKPVPPEKAAYVGEWRAKNMYLAISQDGQVNYKRVEGNFSSSINAPIKEFNGNNFEVGIGPMSTTFMVGKPPYQSGKSWKMEVDGVTLTKADE